MKLKQIIKKTTLVMTFVTLILSTPSCKDDKEEPKNSAPIATIYIVPYKVEAATLSMDEIGKYDMPTAPILISGKEVSAVSDPMEFINISTALGDEVPSDCAEEWQKLYRSVFVGEKLKAIKVRTAEDWTEELPAGSDITELFTAYFYSALPYVESEGKHFSTQVAEKPLNEWTETDGTLIERSIQLVMKRLPTTDKKWLKIEYIFEFEHQTLSVVYDTYLYYWA